MYIVGVIKALHICMICTYICTLNVLVCSGVCVGESVPGTGLLSIQLESDEEDVCLLGVVGGGE